MPSGRRIPRPRNLDLPTHNGGILPGRANADAARAHAAAPARAPRALPVLALRERPRRAHPRAPAGRPLAHRARRVALCDAQRRQRAAREAYV